MTDIKETRTLTLEGALKVLNAAIAEATRIAQPMCIAVVDTGGNLLAFGRMDGSKGLSVTSSINKARTSALSGSRPAVLTRTRKSRSPSRMETAGPI